MTFKVHSNHFNILVNNFQNFDYIYTFMKHGNSAILSSNCHRQNTAVTNSPPQTHTHKPVSQT